MALLDYSFPSVLSDDSLQAYRDKDDDFEDSLHESNLAFPKPTSSSEADSIDRSVINASFYMKHLKSSNHQRIIVGCCQQLYPSLGVHESQGGLFVYHGQTAACFGENLCLQGLIFQGICHKDFCL